MDLLAKAVASLIVWGLYQILLMVQFALCLYFGFIYIYQPLAHAPGARDGAGLILVILVVLIGSIVAASLLTTVEVALLRQFLPSFGPADIESSGLED